MMGFVGIVMLFTIMDILMFILFMNIMMIVVVVSIVVIMSLVVVIIALFFRDVMADFTAMFVAIADLLGMVNTA